MAGKVNIGLEVEKEFGGNTYKGWVTKYFKKEDLYHVKYEDNDEEDVDAEELQRIVTHKPPQTEAAAAQDHGASGIEPTVDRPRRMTDASGAADDVKGIQPSFKRSVWTSNGAAVSSERAPYPKRRERPSQTVSPDTAAAVTLFAMSAMPEPSSPPPSQPGTPFSSPKRRQKTASTAELHSPAGLGASKRATAAAAAAAPEPQAPAKKKTRSGASKAAPPSQTGPSQAAEADPIPADGPAAEAEATAAIDEPAAAVAPAEEAAAVAVNGASPSEPEGPPAPIPPHAAAGGEGMVPTLGPAQGSQRTEHDAGEDLYKGVDIRRTHPATGGRPGPTRFNQVVYNSGFLFLAGQIVDDTSAPGMDSYYGQTKQVLHQVGQLLEASGSSMQRILQVAVHLRDIDEGADEFNKAWLEVMDAKHLPARTTVQAHLMRPDLLVEVTATAAVST